MTANPWDKDPEVGPWEKDPEVGHSGFLDRAFVNPLKYGAADTLKGDAATAKVLGAPDVASTLQQVGEGITPEGYQPVGTDAKKAWDQGHYLDWASYIPRRALESLPQLGQAAAGATIGSLAGPLGTRLGWAAGHGASTFGRNVDDAARSRTGSESANPESSDFLRGALSSAVEAELSRAGTKAATGGVLKAGEATLPAAAAKVGQGALSDAAANVASTVAHKGIIDPNGEANVGDIAESAATGALTGAGLRTSKLPTDAMVLRRNRDISPEAGSRVADRLYATGEDLGTPAGDKAAFEKARDVLQTQRDSNRPRGQTDATNEVMSRVKDDLDQGRPAAEADVNVLKSAFGPDDRYINAIEDHSILNQVRDQATDVNGGLTGGLQASRVGAHVLNPLSKIGGVGELANIGAGLTGTHIAIPALHSSLTGFNPLMGIGVHAGLWGGMKGIDALTGKNRPVSQFAERFRSDDTPFDPSQLPPSFNDRASAQAASVAAANEKLKNMGRTAAIMQNSEALAQKQANAPLAQAKQTSQIMANSQALAAKQANAALQGPAFTSRMMTADAANQAKAQKSDVSFEQAIGREAAKSVEQQRNARLAAVKQTSSIMRNSEQGPTSDARTALAVAKFKQQMEAETAREAAAKQNEQYAGIRQTASIMRNSDPSKTSAGDATMPLRVARLKQQLADKAEREQALKEAGPDAIAQKEDTRAALQSLHEGDGAEERFQARVAQLAEARKAKASYAEAKQPSDKVTQSPKKPKAPKAEPEVTEMPAHPVMRVKEGDQTVDRTTQGVAKAARYAERIRANLKVRNETFDTAAAENPTHAKALKSLVTELNTSNARSRNGAEGVIQRHLQNLPPEVQASVRKHLNEKFWNTWRKVTD